ncbi:MAG: hypothetical protein HOW73_12325 [Polyangiaceae bacterium]|nr:hypothetical protein [Polyangiaceae bacterium]
MKRQYASLLMVIVLLFFPGVAAAEDDDEPPPAETAAPAAPDADAAPSAPKEELPAEPTKGPTPEAGVNAEDEELAPSALDGIEGLDSEAAKALTEVTPAELGNLEVDRPMSPAALDDLEEQAEALRGLHPDDLDKLAKLYLPVIRQQLQKLREKKYEETAAKIRQKSSEQLGTVATALLLLSSSGLFLLLLPLVQRKKYPGQLGKLFGYSALAAASLVLSFILLTGVLVTMRSVQADLAEQTNPQLVLQDATFDALDANLEDLAAYPGAIMVPIQQVGSGEKEDLGAAVLENVPQFMEDFAVFQSIASSLQGAKALMGYVPALMVVLAVALFFLSIKDLVKDVVHAPERAMRGEISGAEVFAMVLRRVRNEILVTLGTLGALFLITLVTAVTMGIVAYPAMSIFVGQLTATMEYVFVQPGASKAYVYIALAGVLLFVVLAVGLMVASGTLFLGKLQAILRARLNNNVPMKTFAPFFRWRILALGWCLALPVVVLVAMSALTGRLTDAATSGQSYNWELGLLPAPLGLLLGFIVLFAAGYGLKAFTSIARFKVPTQPIGDTAVAQAAAALPTVR